MQCCCFVTKTIVSTASSSFVFGRGQIENFRLHASMFHLQSNRHLEIVELMSQQVIRLISHQVIEAAPCNQNFSREQFRLIILENLSIVRD